MSQRAVRLRDVAEAAGTSTKTASRVINGDPRVSADTRSRVQDAITAMGYRVDLTARSLRRGFDDTIGVVVPTIGDPFFAQAIEEIERMAVDRGIRLLVSSNSRDPQIERAVVEGLLARRVAGLLVTPYMTDYGFLGSVGTPVVFFDRHAVGFDSDVVMVDDEAGARRAVLHLAQYGHRRIAVVVDDLGIETSRRRWDGYIAALGELGMEPEDRLQLSGCVDASQAERMTRALLADPNPPTAIFSARSETTLGVVRALHYANRGDIALVSFGDFTNADLLSPPVSVLDHNPRALARAAMDRLLERINGSDGSQASAREIRVPLHLIARGSGEIPLAPAVLGVSA